MDLIILVHVGESVNESEGITGEFTHIINTSSDHGLNPPFNDLESRPGTNKK